MDITQNQYIEGEVAVCRATFTDEAGALQDPTTVKFVFQAPGDVPTEYVYLTDAELVRVSQGVYTVDLNTTGKPGTWFYRFYATGTGATARQNQFHVVTARP